MHVHLNSPLETIQVLRDYLTNSHENYQAKLCYYSSSTDHEF